MYILCLVTHCGLVHIVVHSLLCLMVFSDKLLWHECCENEAVSTQMRLMRIKLIWLVTEPRVRIFHYVTWRARAPIRGSGGSAPSGVQGHAPPEAEDKLSIIGASLH